MGIALLSCWAGAKSSSHAGKEWLDMPRLSGPPTENNIRPGGQPTMKKRLAFRQFRNTARRKAALAACVALCTLGLGLSASDHEPAIITFDAPDAGTGTFQGPSPSPSTRRARSQETTLTRATCCTATCAPLTAPSPPSTLRARSPPRFPPQSTRWKQSPYTTLTQATWFTASCGPGKAPRDFGSVSV